jgi:hypothetical protein
MKAKVPCYTLQSPVGIEHYIKIINKPVFNTVLTQSRIRFIIIIITLLLLLLLLTFSE